MRGTRVSLGSGARASCRAIIPRVNAPCELCDGPSGDVLYEDDLARIVLVDDGEHPGFCRVILNRHVAETTDLTPDDRRHLMDMVFATEKAVRDVVGPDKMNVASLGNVVPHVHWHVIPRRRDDAHFPNPIWGARVRDAAPAPIPPNLVGKLRAAIALELCD